MVHVNVSDNLPSRQTKITSSVPDQHLLLGLIPGRAVVENLIQIPFITEKLIADNPIQPKVLKPVQQRFIPAQLTVGSEPVKKLFS